MILSPALMLSELFLLRLPNCYVFLTLNLQLIVLKVMIVCILKF